MNKIFGKIALLGGGNLLAQLINSFSLLFLAKIYSPDDYAILAIFTSIFTIVTVIGCMRYEQALLIAKENDINELLSLCLYIQRFILFLAFFICFLSYLFFNINSIFLTLPIIIYFSLGISIYQCYELKVKNTYTVSKAIVLRSIFTFISQCFFALFIENGLIWGLMFSLFLIFIILKKDKKVKINFNKEIFFKFKTYPLYYFPFAAVSTISLNSTILIIGKVFGSTYLGLFFLAEKIIKAPSSVLNLALRQILTIHFNEFKDQNKILYFSAFLLFLLSLFFGLICYLFVDFIFNNFFDKKWESVSPIVIYLIPWMIFNIVSTPFIAKIISDDKMVYLLYIQLMEFLLKIALGFYSYLWVLGFYNFIILYCCISFFQFLLCVFAVYYIDLKKGRLL